ncbi:hypothetical protein V2J09_005895 [Rumex salicifolius]
MHGRSKNIDIQFHFLRNLAAEGTISLCYCTSANQFVPLMKSRSILWSLSSQTNTSIHRKNFVTDHATIRTIFGHRRGKLTLEIQQDPHSPPLFVIELPIYAAALHREMETDALRIAFESGTKATKKKLLEEYVWGVYCNGRKFGYSIRRKEMTEEECHVMRLLKGVSMGAGVLPCFPEEKTVSASPEGEMTYMRARFERVVGSKDSEAMYMINPEGAHDSLELSIFFVRIR